MKKLLFLAVLILVCVGPVKAQTVQCQASNGAWGPCPLVSPVAEAQAVNSTTSTTGTSVTHAWGSSTTAGNSILCLGMEAAAAAPTWSDGQANTFVIVASSTTAPGYSIVIAQNIVGGTTDTITMTVTSGGAAFACHELKGTVTVGQAWDINPTAQQATSATLNFPQAQIAAPNEMIFAMVGLNGGTVNATPSLAGVPTGLVTVDQANTTITAGALDVIYSAHANVSSTPGPFTQNISLSASETYTGILISVRPASLNEWIVASNPCLAPGPATLTSAQGATSGTSATQIIALSGTTKIYVCQLYIVSVSGTTPTFSLVYGTGSNCATGQATIFPAIATATTAGTIYPFPGNPFLVVPAGQALCYLDGGTTPIQNYMITYVQR